MADEDRQLHLLRHAKSSWTDSDLTDHARPLSGRGRRACASLVPHLRALETPPELVLCSSAARTVETLERIRSGLPADAAVHIEDDLYGAWWGALLDRIRDLPDTCGSVLVIGHNPGLEELAVVLTGHGDPALRARLRTKFPTAALATLSFTGSWPELGPQTATLVDYLIPAEHGLR